MLFWLLTIELIFIQPSILIGPDFWGLMHKHWRMCKAGKLQSPINMDPEKLVFDPGLGKLSISKEKIENSELWNTGQFPLLFINNSNNNNNNIYSPNSGSVKLSGGPAFPYNYQFQQMKRFNKLFHFGDISKGEVGSEHTINRVRFPAEVQLLAFNSDLYENFTQAQSQPKGLLAVGLIVDIGERTNSELKRLAKATINIKYRSSLTYPGCFETVTWVIFNSPIYITTEDLNLWSELLQNEKPKEINTNLKIDDSLSSPSIMTLSSNFRPLKAQNGRILRTNINIKLKPSPSFPSYSSSSEGNCPSNVYVDMGYQLNPKRTEKRLLQNPMINKNI
ncbi:Alpha-carbonic anhydrase domain-containing protein [Meloidogyne graminicola]|uniref:Alpha-carbonic anhydrase domain-containing protein n=1 Tax=Meloidogyne graminicola TaxID=189291 RepID=A0A8S9ZTN5_9BILA|nr:Alpha-carbonic anhydrase domain-containing protein [Meloidogyne graminicola]